MKQQESSCGMRSESSKMLVLGKNWTTICSVVSKYSGKVSNKLEQGWRQNMADVDQVHQSNQRLQAVLSCGKSN